MINIGYEYWDPPIFSKLLNWKGVLNVLKIFWNSFILKLIPSRSHDTLTTVTIGKMLIRCRRSTVDYQRWYNVEKQLAQPYSDRGKSNLPTVDVQGLSSVYSAPVVDCEIPAFVQCWMYNRPKLLPTVEKIISRQ